MGPFTVQLTHYDILRTRSRHEDTNHIVATLSVSGRLVGDPQTKFMGNQNDGTFLVGFSWPPVNVAEGETLTLFYQILNSGHQNPGEVEQALAGYAAAAATQLPGGSVATTIFDVLAGFLNADCDGPIAPPQGRKVVWHDFELRGLAPGTTGEESVSEHGNDSPSGCGGNSHYVVHFSVTA